MLALVFLLLMSAPFDRSSAMQTSQGLVVGELRCTTIRTYAFVGFDQYGPRYEWVWQEHCTRTTPPPLPRESNCVPLFDIEHRLLAYACP